MTLMQIWSWFIILSIYRKIELHKKNFIFVGLLETHMPSHDNDNNFIAMVKEHIYIYINNAHPLKKLECVHLHYTFFCFGQENHFFYPSKVINACLLKSF